MSRGFASLLLGMGLISALGGLGWAQSPDALPETLKLKPLKAHKDMSWAVAMARQDAFYDVPRILDVTPFEAKDPAFEENRLAVQEGRDWVGNRHIHSDDGGFYSVAHFKENKVDRLPEKPTLYYSSRGNLKAIEVWKETDTVVKRYTYLYGPYAEHLGLQSGQLLFATVSYTAEEEFVFDTTENLHGHWIGDQCFRQDGTRCFLNAQAKP